MNTKMPKIFLISNMYPSALNPSYGIFIYNIEKGLSENGVRFVAKALIRKRCSNIFLKIFTYLYFYITILKLGLTSEFDIIYCHYISHTIVPAALIKTIKDKKLVANVHGEDIIKERLVYKLFGSIIRVSLKKADLIISPSRYCKRMLTEAFKIENNSISVFPSGGVDGRIFKPMDKNICRKKRNLEETGFYVGYVSRIDKNKGWDILIRAMGILKKRNFKFKLIFAGSGCNKEVFLEYITKFDLEKESVFLGNLRQNDLNQVYNMFDVSIFPTLEREGLGLVGLEALSCGIPVIASRLGAIEEYIKHGSNGFLFEAGDYKGLAERIQAFYNLPQKDKLKMQENCIADSSKFGSKKIMRDMSAVFNALVYK